VLLSQMRAGLVGVLAADPKLMELAYGRVILDTFGRYDADPRAIAAMLEQGVTDMQARAAVLAGTSATTCRRPSIRSSWSWSTRWPRPLRDDATV
jgi:hypothetical protein